MPRYTFGPFLLDTEARALLRDGAPIQVTGKTFDTLVVLVQNRGRLVDKDELLSEVWAGTVVEEANLSQAIFTVRKILGDSPKDPRFIATIAGRGYQFVAPVAELNGEAPQAQESDSVIIGTLVKPRKKVAPVGLGVAVVAALVGAAWFLMHRPPKPSAELKQDRLTFNSSENPVKRQAISPDGKYLAYSDPAGIHVKLLATEEDRLIPRPAGIPAGSYWLVFSWFPDGTQLLADAWEPGGRKSTWTVSVLGQSPRKLREDAVGFEVSPDGTHIAFQSGTSSPGPWRPNGAEFGDQIREIWVMGSQGDNPQKILALGEHEWLRSVHWSPDGHRLAYIRHLLDSERVQRSPSESSQRVRTSIETCDLKGANRTVVMPDMHIVPADFRWLPDGRIVYVRSDSGSADGNAGSGDGNLWEIGIDNHAGTPIGKPTRISQWAGSFLMSMSASADGKRLALLKLVYQWQTFLGELAAGGTRLKLAHRLTNNEAAELPTAWTADSKTVLLSSNRGGRWGMYKQGISPETSEHLITGQQLDSYGRVSPDGGWIVFMEVPKRSANPAPPARLLRIPVSGGAPQLVLETRNWVDFRCTHSPANPCVIFETSQDRKQFTVTEFDPVKGRGRVLRTIENDPLHTYDKADISPDNSMLAISRIGEAEIHIRLLSLSGGSDREITVKGWPNITGIDWSPDGKGLYCGSASPLGSTLLYVDLKGSARMLWQYKGGGQIIWGAPSPDGHYLAIGVEVTYSNVWMVTGFK
jgi:DNA-binding winged helix-turn-helix (wHTH) protein/Tol biopolymer transport system component